MSSQLIATAESVVRRAPVGMLEVRTGMRDATGRLGGHGFPSMETACNYTIHGWQRSSFPISLTHVYTTHER